MGNARISGYVSTSTARPNIDGTKVMLCIGWDQLGVVYYELLKPNESITGDRYRNAIDAFEPSIEGETAPVPRETRQSCHPAWQYVRSHVARPVKTYLETLKWEVLSHPPYSSDVTPSDYHLFRSMAHGLAHQHFRSYKEVKKWVDSLFASKNASFFRDDIWQLPDR